MKKLKLDLKQIRVQSFEVPAVQKNIRGTVKANATDATFGCPVACQDTKYPVCLTKYESDCTEC